MYARLLLPRSIGDLNVAAGLTLAIAAIIALATALFGWWAVPGIGLALGLLSPARARPGSIGALAGALAWGILLTWTAALGPVDRVADTVGALVGVPGPVIYLITLIFPAVLAGCAAVVGSAMRQIGGAIMASQRTRDLASPQHARKS